MGTDEGEPGDGGGAPPDSTQASRRSFLKATGIAAAGFAVGGVAGAAAGTVVGRAVAQDPARAPGALEPRPAPGFDHLVVLMGENRSFDNLLGWLYTPGTLPQGQSFDGLAFGDHSNRSTDGSVIPAHVYEGATDVIMNHPSPDPGEEYTHVNTQLFGVIDPPGNADVGVGETKPPYNAPAAGAKPTMDGFVRDYRVAFRQHRGTEPTPDDLRTIMGGFSPEMLPVLSTLAREFAVYDHWHCAVPSQTFCNRSFFHASTSHGFVTNMFGGGYRKWLDAPAAPTVFNRLEEAGVSWRIYFDELQLVSFTGVLHAPVLEKYWKTEHFATMAQFFDDAEKGNLPAYSFIEPRMVYNHNDFHPPVGRIRSSEVDGQDVYDSAISDVRAGEALVHQVYSAIRTSASAKGSNALNTMLLITFDEHGGTYDHVPPPAATPPHPGTGEMGFAFDRLGCRVPAIAVSAYTRKGTVINEEMHHAAVIATLSRVHGLRPLTDRDDGANTLFSAISLDTPRQPSDWPQTTPQYVPPNPEGGSGHPGRAHEERPLSPPAQGLLGILLAKYGTADEQAHPPQTYADAYRILTGYGAGLFGV